MVTTPVTLLTPSSYINEAFVSGTQLRLRACCCVVVVVVVGGGVGVVVGGICLFVCLFVCVFACCGHCRVVVIDGECC